MARYPALLLNCCSPQRITGRWTLCLNYYKVYKCFLKFSIAQPKLVLPTQHCKSGPFISFGGIQATLDFQTFNLLVADLFINLTT